MQSMSRQHLDLGVPPVDLVSQRREKRKMHRQHSGRAAETAIL